jgi:hypothetical protein
MEENKAFETSEINTGTTARKNFKKGGKLSPEKAMTNHGNNKMISEEDENFFHYINRCGLVNEPNMLVLPSSNHYYYDNNELQGVTTLVNMKKLNRINHLDSFLHSVCDVLSPKTNFIGCFYDKKTQETGLSSRMYKRFINFLDAKTDNEIDRSDVSRLLESRGYKVIDMTEINGLTYFRTQNLGLSA